MDVENVALGHHPQLGNEPKWFFYHFELDGKKRYLQAYAAKDEATHRAIVVQRCEDLEREAAMLRAVLAAATPAEVD